MADEEQQLTPDEIGENTMLREAISALRAGDRRRARDLLTRLLKANQQNANYWVWLSAVVDTPKERLYCLQSAAKLEPENPTIQRGLLLLGALQPDEAQPPFPMNRPRLWEEKTAVESAPQETARGWANPVARAFMVVGIAILAIGIFVGGYVLLLPKGNAPSIFSNPTRRPTSTLVFTPTGTPLVRTPTPTFQGPTPLYLFLEEPYTPTPLYMATEHPVLTQGSFEAGLSSLAHGDYEMARVQFQEVLKSEPNAMDVYYLIGETYRAEGDYQKAQDSYQKIINKDSSFAPAFLGRARVKLAQNPGADVLDDLNTAIALDPRFAEAFIERGAYLVRRDPSGAKADLETALELSPDSALAYYYLASTYLNLGDDQTTIELALHANQIDITIIPVYLVLGRAYLNTGQYEPAVGVLQTYTLFTPQDTGANMYLGTAYNATGNYQLAVDVLTKTLDADSRNAEAHYQRGYAYLQLEKANLAEQDLNLAVAYEPNDFDAQVALARVYDMQGSPGDAYQQISSKAYPLANTDSMIAQVYYWEAIFLEKVGNAVSLEGARNSWHLLISLPEDAMPPEWRAQAFQQLNITPTPIPQPSPTRTPTKTPKP